MIELRWYQTYDEHGVDSAPTLQSRIVEEDQVDEWEDVEFVRERDPDADLEPQY
jgi:hypothetical protein